MMSRSVGQVRHGDSEGNSGRARGTLYSRSAAWRVPLQSICMYICMYFISQCILPRIRWPFFLVMHRQWQLRRASSRHAPWKPMRFGV